MTIKIVKAPDCEPSNDSIGDWFGTSFLVILMERMILYPVCAIAGGSFMPSQRVYGLKAFFVIAFVVLFIVFLAIGDEKKWRN